MTKKPIIRCGTVVIKDDELLLVHSNYDNDEFWIVPGGGLELGETLEECAIREVKEETNLNIKIKKLLFVRDFIKDNTHVVDVFFLGKIISGELATGNDPDQKVQVIQKVEFIPISKLNDYRIFPQFLPKMVKEGVKNNFSNINPYVGNAD